MITGMDSTARTERTMVMVMMESVAVMPIPIMRPTVVYVPPARVISPIPRTVPCYPIRTPEPIVDNRSVHIYRFDDIVGTIHVLIAHYLHFHLVLCFVFLHIYRGYVLIDILSQNSL